MHRPPNLCITPYDGVVAKAHHQPSLAAAKLHDALDKLHNVDKILEKLGLFWANTEVVLDALTKKGQTAEQFIAFAHKPKLMARFQERMQDYRNFWKGVRGMCHSIIQDTMDKDQESHFIDKVPGAPGSLNSAAAATDTGTYS